MPKDLDPMIRVNAYATKLANGDVSFDVEGMILDWLVVVKATGHSLEEAQSLLAQMWAEVEVTVSIPKRMKN